MPTPVWVHRKGATRAFGPGHPDLPPVFRETGQPVIIPGDMGTESWLLVGTERAMGESFGSACPRRRPQAVARRGQAGQERRRGAPRARGEGHHRERAVDELLAEEAPYAYKDVREIVDVVDGAGLARKVARLKPIGVLKG